MRTQIPLAPLEPDFGMVHIVLNVFGSLGRAYVETDEANADEATIVENILGGQYSCPLRVVAFNIAEGWAEDVTEDYRHCRAKPCEEPAPLNRKSRAGLCGEGAWRGSVHG